MLCHARQLEPCSRPSTQKCFPLFGSHFGTWHVHTLLLKVEASPLLGAPPIADRAGATLKCHLQAVYHAGGRDWQCQGRSQPQPQGQTPAVLAGLAVQLGSAGRPGVLHLLPALCAHLHLGLQPADHAVPSQLGCLCLGHPKAQQTVLAGADAALSSWLSLVHKRKT